MFKLAGGWYAVRALDVFLQGGGEAAWKKAVDEGPHTDVDHPSPRFMAIRVLRMMFSDLPVIAPGKSEDTAHIARVYHEWIAAHQIELKKLEPTGEGVIFSRQACKPSRR